MIWMVNFKLFSFGLMKLKLKYPFLLVVDPASVFFIKTFTLLRFIFVFLSATWPDIEIVDENKKAFNNY